MIPITKPYIESKDIKYLKDVINSKIFTDGKYQIKTEYFIKKGDEVILPSYGFVSIANAIVLRGAKPIFADVDPDTLNISAYDIEKKITKKTVAIYLIHYENKELHLHHIFP